MTLFRLVYASRAADALTPSDHDQILVSSRRNNGKAGVTGLLAFSAREFLQCLEGSREAVSTTYGRILADPRHQDVQLIDCRAADVRWFGEWGMHGLPPSKLTRQRVLRYSERELFTPTRMSSGNVLALLADLAQELDAEQKATAPLEPAVTSSIRPSSEAPREGLLAKIGLKREN
ncbi:BLUF domain-containing protein [Silanimonas sp.]|uniref:BLUF domain-containing protein n=1 Tax=Silanimonas sp. TaxID=1929290 RepID=UPI001BC2E1C6|nr:BLUF domain-containing protein [Silanimonas sp.]MBS3895918.1 BLUF domain-containing protein [Silanimonas sp.]